MEAAGMSMLTLPRRLGGCRSGNLQYQISYLSDLMQRPQHIPPDQSPASVQNDRRKVAEESRHCNAIADLWSYPRHPYLSNAGDLNPTNTFCPYRVERTAATNNSGLRVRGIRFTGVLEMLWSPTQPLFGDGLKC